MKEEKEKEAMDPFFVEKEEILKMMRDVKANQDERNGIRRTVGRSHKMMSLNRDIVTAIKSAEKRIDDLNKMLRKQAKKVSFISTKADKPLLSTLDYNIELGFYRRGQIEGVYLEGA